MRVLYGMLAACVIGAACKDGNGPDGLTYPDLSAAVRSTFCVMSNVTAGDNPGGVISSADCDANDVDPSDVGYYEVYIVKVASARSVTFEVSSAFDSYLTLLRLDSFTATSVNLTGLGEDDDSGSGLDAMLSYALQPGVNYVIAVGGYDYTETGSYSLAIR